jgi:hypothetical protein
MLADSKTSFMQDAPKVVIIILHYAGTHLQTEAQQ